MKILLVIIGIIVLIVIISKSKRKHPITNSTFNQNQNKQKFTAGFPDRTASIGVFKEKIDKSIQTGNIDIANLNFAKLVESLRQQNINENGVLEKDLEYAIKKYSEFRDFYNVDYPEQFSPPEERKKAQSKYDNDYVLLTTLNYNELPKQILKHIDKIKTAKEWRELRLSPKKEQYGDWKPLKRQERYFDFKSIKQIDNYKEAIESSKRITKNPYYISALIEQGCNTNEFLFVGEDIRFFITGLDKQDKADFDSALLNITKAVELNPLKEYSELESDLKARLGDLNTIKQKFKQHEFDIDSPIHTGEIYDWLKGLVLKNEYTLITMYIKQSIDILDNLTSGRIKSKIYGQQSSDWYSYKKEDFHKNILSITKGVDFTEDLKTKDLSDLFQLIAEMYIGKQTKPLEDLGDILNKHSENSEAKKIYIKCLKMIGSDEKPRVRDRIQKKIEKIYNNEVKTDY